MLRVAALSPRRRQSCQPGLVVGCDLQHLPSRTRYLAMIFARACAYLVKGWRTHREGSLRCAGETTTTTTTTCIIVAALMANQSNPSLRRAARLSANLTTTTTLQTLRPLMARRSEPAERTRHFRRLILAPTRRLIKLLGNPKEQPG